MLENIKNLFTYYYVQKCIEDKNYELALEKLNMLAKDEFRPADTFMKRGILCHKLLMFDEAYSDFSYVINNCVKKQRAYYERMKLNYEMGNYFETIGDSNKILEDIPDNYECKIYKFLSYLFLGQTDLAKSYILDIFSDNKYRAIQFLFNETAKNTAQDELAIGLKLLDVIELLDPDNPIKIFKEANIYGLAGNDTKKDELMKRLESVFPKYFISHFHYSDMYEDRDLLETSFLLELKIFDTQNSFDYPMSILEGYKNSMEGHILDSKEAFENAIRINPEKPEAYVLLAQTLQLLSGYDNPAYKQDAEVNYRKAMAIYQRENLTAKTEDMKRQIKHLNSNLSFH